MKPPRGTIPSVPESSAAERVRAARQKSRQRMIWVGGTALSLLVMISLVLALKSRPGNRDGDETGGRIVDGAEGAASALAPLPEPGGPALGPHEIGKLRVYTQTPGLFVLIGGEPARDEAGALLKTPCEIVLPRGDFEVLVGRGGGSDQTQFVKVEENSEVFFESPQTDAAPKSVFDAKYFALPQAEPTLLQTLTTTAEESDPFVTRDGRAIYFAASRFGVRGLYVATRETVYHEFNTPQLLELSRGYDLPGSPSVSGDALTIMYVVPERGTLLALSRENPLADFSQKKEIKVRRHPGANWPAAQLLGDSRNVYWAESRQGTTTIHHAARKTPQDEFGNASPVEMPGTLPVLSSDGLRQFLFDGNVLRRARRGSLDGPFAEPELIANISLKNYVASKRRRQFFVSDDEQWLYYSDNPEESGDLHVVRLFQGRNWGHKPRGKSIPPKAAPLAKTDMRPPRQNEGDLPFVIEKPKPRPDDPRNVPLPYPNLRPRWIELAGERKYAAARQLLTEAIADPKFAADRELLKWDLAELEQAEKFWGDVRSAAGKLKAGDQVRAGGTRAVFVQFQEDEVVYRIGQNEIRKKVPELATESAVSLAESDGKTHPADQQYRAAMFLAVDPRLLNRRSAETRLDRSGDAGKIYRERLAERILHLAKTEFARRNIFLGLKRLEELEKEHPNSTAAKSIPELRASTFDLAGWREAGQRSWKRNGREWIAGSERHPGSILLSRDEYEAFELRLEWKSEGMTPTGNGGVFFRHASVIESEDRKPLLLLLANDNGIAADRFSTGSIFKREAPTSNPVKPAGQWNTLVMQVDGDLVRATINGVQVLDTKVVEPTIPLKGNVALDGSMGGITYRNILLVDLPPGTLLQSRKR